MPKLSPRQVGLALLVFALFAPVFLSSASAAFRPDWLTARIATVPVSVVIVIALMAVFVSLTWVFSGMVIGAPDKGDEG